MANLHVNIKGFSMLLLKPKSNQTDEGAHGYQKQLESVTLRPI